MKNQTMSVESPDALLALLKDFKQHLDQEQKVLLDASADNVDTLATRKYQLLQKINSVSPALLKKLNEDTESNNQSDDVEQIKHFIRTCKEQNQENGVLVAQGLKVCRNSLELLSFSTQQRHTELYDPNGLSSPELSKRDLGQA